MEDKGLPPHKAIGTVKGFQRDNRVHTIAYNCYKVHYCQAFLNHIIARDSSVWGSTVPNLL